MMDTKSKYPELFKLPIDERIKLAQDLWDSIPDDPELFPLTDEEREELERRLDDYEQNPDEGKPWEEVLKRLRK